MRLVNSEITQKDGLTVPQYLNNCFSFLAKENNYALVCCINNKKTDGNGYLLGIAERNQKGYTPTFYILNDHDYDTCNNWVTQTNRLLFNRDEKETYKIISSSM